MQQLADSATRLRADFPIFERAGRRRSSTSTRPRRPRSRARARRARGAARPCTTRTSTAVSTRSPRRPTGLRSGAQPDRRVHRRQARGTIFTKNATEALNLVAYAYGRSEPAARRRGPDHRARAPRKHRPVAAGLRRDRRDAAPPVGRRGRASCRSTQLDRELERGDVRIVAFAHVSNVLGTINPAAEICRRVRAAGAVSVVDGAQAVPAAARRRRRDRRGLLRLDRTQGARPDRHRRTARPYRRCSSRCPRS